jgi:hypothetical protein
MGMIAAYWSKDGLGIYRIEKDKEPDRIAAGDIKSIKPIGHLFQTKVLIIGRDQLCHIRRRYPPASPNEIRKAVAFEIAEIFPLKEPTFFCRICETYKTHIFVDIWGWEKEEYAQVRKVFPFLYVIPEDLAFSSNASGVKIFRHNEMIHLVAHEGNRFVGAATFPAVRFEASDLERFMVGLEPLVSKIKEITVFGSFPLPDLSQLPLKIVHRPVGAYPPVLACLDKISPFSPASRQFLVLPEFNLWEKRHLLFRISLYLVLGYAGMLSLTLMYHEQAIRTVRLNVAQINRTLQSAAADTTGAKSGDEETIRQEFNDYAGKIMPPLKAMELLAHHLPEGTQVNGITLREYDLEVSFSSGNPLEVIKKLSGVREVKKVQLKGAPVKDAKSGSYKFTVALQLLK